MIFFTTFILTLILSYVARAVPACGGVVPPEELHEPYEATFDAEPIFLEIAAWDTKYDDWNGNTNSVTCSNLSHQYPHFHNLPDFPYIGASFVVKRDPGCSRCWKLTNPKTSKSIFLLDIDATKRGFKLGKKVFEGFTGETEEMKIEAQLVSLSDCDFH